MLIPNTTMVGGHTWGRIWRRRILQVGKPTARAASTYGSRYRLEIDHIVPFALGGGAQPANLRIRCGAHHRYRHAQRHARAADLPTDSRHAGAPMTGPADRRQSEERLEASQ